MKHVAFEPSQVDAIIAGIIEAKKNLSVGHGAQGGVGPALPEGEPATRTSDSRHETPGRQSIPEAMLKELLSYIGCQSESHAECHREEVTRILREDS